MEVIHVPTAYSNAIIVTAVTIIMNTPYEVQRLSFSMNGFSGAIAPYMSTCSQMFVVGNPYISTAQFSRLQEIEPTWKKTH